MQKSKNLIFSLPQSALLTVSRLPVRSVLLLCRGVLRTPAPSSEGAEKTFHHRLKQ